MKLVLEFILVWTVLSLTLLGLGLFVPQLIWRLRFWRFRRRI